MALTALNYPTIQPSLTLDFAKAKQLDPRIAFTRASAGTYVGSDGLIKTAANNVPRFDHNPVTGESLGLLVEEQRTNEVRNSSASGAVAGSPGTLPTGWTGQGNANGWTREVVSSGTDPINGLPYVDIRLYGTPSHSAFSVSFLSQGNAAAVDGESWAGSLYHRLVAGSMSNVIGYPAANFWNSSLVFIGSLPLAGNIVPSASWSRYTGAATIANASTAFISWSVTFTCTVGTAYDFTIRFAAPQLEKGSFVTSWIPNTSTNSAVTRSADVASISGSNFSSWYRQDAGSVFVSSNLFANVNTYVASFTDNTNNNHHYLRYLALQHQVSSSAGGVANTNIYSDGGGSVLAARTAYSYGSGAYTVSTNGIRGAFSSTTGGISSTVDRLNIGFSQVSGATGNLTIRRLVFWPTTLSGTALQSITQ